MLLLLLLSAAGPLDGLVGVLASSDDPALQRDVLSGMGEALAGRRALKTPAGWAGVYRKLSASKDGEVRRRVAQLSLLFGVGEALADLKRAAADPKADGEDRAFALQALLDRGEADTFPLVRSLLDDPALARPALRGLARFDDKETPQLVLSRYGKLSPEGREDAVGTLASRPAYALALLDAIEAKAVPRADVSAFWARQMVALKDPAVARRLAAVWGTIRPAAKDRDALMTKYRTLAVKEGDRVKGRGLFARTCASCHKLFGEGGAIGPELTGSQRRNPEYILLKVLDPNATVPREHLVTLVRTKRGRLISGVVKSDDGKVLLMQTPTEEVRVRVADVETREPQRTSLMPENQLKDWPDGDVRDLLAYLAGEDQVGLPPK
ncbi:MAG: c-type cytochrome [Gemmataceae bacterium]